MLHYLYLSDRHAGLLSLVLIALFTVTLLAATLLEMSLSERVDRILRSFCVIYVFLFFGIAIDWLLSSW